MALPVRVQSFAEMTNLPKSLIEKLEEEFVVNPLKQRIVQESKDGTIKYLFELPDGMLIENGANESTLWTFSLCNDSSWL